MAYVNVCVSTLLKEELSWGIDKQLWLIINTMLYLNSYTTKNLMNKAVFNNLSNTVCIAM